MLNERPCLKSTHRTGLVGERKGQGMGGSTKTEKTGTIRKLNEQETARLTMAGGGDGEERG